MAGAASERQETAFIRVINTAISKNKNQAIHVKAGNITIKNVFLARKATFRTEEGSEAYTDVVVSSKREGNINLSLKGESVPSLAGGGLRGLECIIPGIGHRFMKAALNKLLEMGYKKGDKIPDVYGTLNKKDLKKIVIGTPAMGGPIHYMYQGPMSVKYEFDTKSKTLTVNGNLTESEEYAETQELYFRLRARREDQTFDPEAEAGGTPKVYGRSPSKGDSAGRIVVTDSVPKEALIVKVS